ncbi:TPA: hypothetical protein ACNZ7M_003757 [Enterobacter kobei]|uniref:hypothetical protein n=1 Tax=Enterobacter kobei TaxID=208224 RepID=UPI003B8805C3
MDLQAWDNIISIASNTVTAVSVVGGVLFGKQKVDEYLRNKKKSISLDIALKYYDEVTNLRHRIQKIQILMNSVIHQFHNLNESKTVINPTDFFNIQTLSHEYIEETLSLSKLFVKLNRFNIEISKKSWSIVDDNLQASHRMSEAVTNFFAYVLTCSNGKAISKEELSDIKSLYQKFQVEASEYSNSVQDFQSLVFDETFIFK